MHPKKTLSNKDTKFQTKAWIDKNMLHKIKACVRYVLLSHFNEIL